MTTTIADVPRGRKSLLDRLLSLAAEVRPGEAVTALLLALDVFLLLTAYYAGIKPVREALILEAPGGAELKSYTGALQSALFLFIVPAYSAFARRVNRIRLINWMILFFVSNLVLFFLLGRAGVSLGVVFFLWAGIFNVMAVAQFWSFANDLYTPEEGKRLFAIVGVGGVVGSVAGSGVATRLIPAFGLYGMMLVSAGLLIASLVLTDVIHFREKRRARTEAQREQADRPLGAGGGFRLVLAERYLLLIGLMTLVHNYVNTNGEYILGRAIKDAANQTAAGAAAGGLSTAQLIGSSYASFQLGQNLLAALIQIFLVSRIFKYLGVGRALFILPLISLSGYALLVVAPVLGLIRGVKTVENATDYSLQGTVRRALFLPTSREAKYKALQAVETFFWRAGDMVSAATVFVGAGLFGLTVRAMAGLNLGLVVGWLLLSAAIARENRRRMEASAAQPPSET
jgi:AAA family ATP:ADP antiporter